jgi:sugar O-acyltransferase (sialic acid O-acetyltransferase NeuD family)
MKGVVLFGDGDLATLAQYYLTHDSPHEVSAFTVDGAFVRASEHRGLPMVAFEEVTERYPPDDFGMLVMVGYSKMNKIREAKYVAAKALGYELISYVASSTVTWPDVVIGENCFIQEANVLQPFSTIGNDVIMWSGCYLGHGSHIGDHCFVASHVVISGHVTVGAYCFIGGNATLRDSITIGPECVIGASALVKNDTKPQTVYVGPRAERLTLTSDRLPKI